MSRGQKRHDGDEMDRVLVSIERHVRRLTRVSGTLLLLIGVLVAVTFFG